MLVGMILFEVISVRNVRRRLDLRCDVDLAGHFEGRAAGAVFAVEQGGVDG